MSVPRNFDRLTFLLLHTIPSILFFFGFRILGVQAVDKIDVGSNITDGKTLVSAGGSFTLGFFSPPGLPSKRYLGVWFSFSPDSVYWVANRDRPLNDTSGVLVMSSSGTLVLMDGTRNAVWSSTLTTSAATGARLLETGNFVVQGQNNGTALWQAFDHPCNTLLPGMKMGKNLWNGDEWYLSSWRSPTDPAPGGYRYITEPGGGTPENVLWYGNNTKKYRTGPWNGERFGGVPEMASYASNFTYHLTISRSEVTYAYSAKPGAPYSQLKLSEDGVVQRLVWDGGSREWNSFLKEPRDGCDDYGKCGPFGLCDRNGASTSPCSCVRGFVPASPNEWSLREYSDGCRRNVSLDCSNQSRTSTDGFQVVGTVKLPDTQNASVDMGISPDECRVKCLANCSCVAYAAADVRGGGGGSGCITWTNTFADLRLIDGGQDFYLRLPKSELGGKNKKKFPVAIVAIVVAIFGSLILVAVIILWVLRRRRPAPRPADDLAPSSTAASAVPLIDYQILSDATDNFSSEKKIGQGFFGTVYQCTLPGSESAMIGIPVGTKVALKVLNQSEMNSRYERELQVVFGLRQINLVRLLASCNHRTQDNHGREIIVRILVYEYMERRSLDLYIFGDTAHRAMLDWDLRLKIVSAIANGILYLHEDSGSGSNIIHRDLKPHNVLLNDNWDPKIADFGFAKPYIPNPTDPHTSVFCWGYSAPECWQGNITLKYDIYSFGVVLLEIISGEVNGPTQRLLSHVWGLWDSSKTLDLLDPAVPPFPQQAEPNLLAKLERCIQIGLLCVQELPEQRPDIREIVGMLKGQIPQLTRPRRPTLRRDVGETSDTTPTAGSATTEPV